EAAELVVAPVLKEPFRLGGHQPVTGIREFPPLVYLIAKLVDDDRGSFVLLLCAGKPLAFVENYLTLARLPLLLLGLGNRSNKLCAPPSLDNLLCGLSFFIELPMTFRVAVRRVQNGAFEEVVIHVSVSGPS